MIETRADRQIMSRYPPPEGRITRSPSSKGCNSIWHDNLLLSCRSSTNSSISDSVSFIGANRSTQTGSTNTWHVAQEQPPPQSALIASIQSRSAVRSEEHTSELLSL